MCQFACFVAHIHVFPGCQIASEITYHTYQSVCTSVDNDNSLGVIQPMQHAFALEGNYDKFLLLLSLKRIHILCVFTKIIVPISSHYTDVTMSELVSQITSLTIVYSAVYSGKDQGKRQSSASLAFVTGEFPAQRASNAEIFSIWWRHHLTVVAAMLP